MTATPESGTLAGRVSVLFEDSDLLAVDKPAGLVAHPAYRHPDGTLDDWVKAYVRRRNGGPAWLLHRLDRDTSGVVLYAKTERARRFVVRQFERREVRKGYLALVAGHFGDAIREVCQPLRRDPQDRRRSIVDATGQPAVTRFIPLAAAAQRSLIFCRPVTGRTHQIRVHLAWLGHPIVGDAVYAPTLKWDVSGYPRQLLHALMLSVRHPASGEPQSIWAPPPDDLRAAMPPGWLEWCDRARLVARGAWEKP
jgi:23S rRNA pseudouridine1911/1915/1917 synthase